MFIGVSFSKLPKCKSGCRKKFKLKKILILSIRRYSKVYNKIYIS